VSEINVGPLGTVVAAAFGASSPGHAQVLCFSQYLLFFHSSFFSGVSGKLIVIILFVVIANSLPIGEDES
jgi:hypothetical protein